jgi:hypothetical protein
VRQQRPVLTDERQYGERSSTEVRATLLELTREFVANARTCPGVSRIALVGSILSSKPRPKDVDVLVSVSASLDMGRLAKLGRRLKGSAQARLNSGADVFVADDRGRYLGRVCHYRECHPRVLCYARHCGAVPHLADDLDAVCLDATLVATPPVELWPTVITRIEVPDDVERLLLAPLRQSVGAKAVSG